MDILVYNKLFCLQMSLATVRKVLSCRKTHFDVGRILTYLENSDVRIYFSSFVSVT